MPTACVGMAPEHMQFVGQDEKIDGTRSVPATLAEELFLPGRAAGQFDAVYEFAAGLVFWIER